MKRSACDVLKDLKKLYEEDEALDDEFDFLDILDYLAILEVPNASDIYDIYFDLLQRIN